MAGVQGPLGTPVKTGEGWGHGKGTVEGLTKPPLTSEVGAQRRHCSQSVPCQARVSRPFVPILIQDPDMGPGVARRTRPLGP